MAGRLYTVVFSGVAVTAQQDLFEINCNNKSLQITRISLAQETEIGDAMEEMLHLNLKTGMTTSGSGGSAPTPQPVDISDAAAAFTAEVNNTTKSSTGTISTKLVDAWNIRAPYLWLPTPEEKFVISGTTRLALELATTPADSITMNGTMVIEEF